MSAIPKSMRAVEPGTIEGKPHAVLLERPVPQPSDGQILIKVAAAGLNRGDLLQVAGFYPPPPGAPQTLGLEASGHVVAAGRNVTKWKVGDAVCVLVAGGGYADYCVADEGSALPIPKGVSVVDAAALPEVYFTVWTNVIDRARLKPGESFLVHGGSSGVGTAAIQLFAARGHHVFTTAGSAAKCAACEKFGAKLAINYRERDFVEEIRNATAGQGVDVILDMVGGDYIAKNIGLLKTEGRLVNIAYQKGAEATLNFLTVMLKRLTITASTLRIRSPKEKAAIGEALAREVWPLLDSGRIQPVIDTKLPLERANEALKRLESSAHIGKILLTV
jgi:putative PIG3 family NAD(P)H quinone oxidoreductase